MCKIGVSGHRNLKKSEIVVYENQIREYFLKKKKQYGEDIILITSLAQGADILATKVAYELGIKYEVLFPFAKDWYIMDFEFDCMEMFNFLLRNSYKSYSQIDDSSIYEESISKDYKKFKKQQYKLLGDEILKKCDVIFVL